MLNFGLNGSAWQTADGCQIPMPGRRNRSGCNHYSAAVATVADAMADCSTSMHPRSATAVDDAVLSPKRCPGNRPGLGESDLFGPARAGLETTRYASPKAI